MKKVIKQILSCPIFLDTERKNALDLLLQAAREKYASYSVEDTKRRRMYWFSLDLWNTLQNEFYETSDISINTFWSWQDKLDQFDEFGYLFYDSADRIETLTEWADFVRNLRPTWAFDVLKFIRDYKSEGMPPEYLDAFKDELRKTLNRCPFDRKSDSFSSVMMKWFDLTRWSPWKLSIYDESFAQPVSVHYEDDFNPEVEDSDAYLD